MLHDEDILSTVPADPPVQMRWWDWCILAAGIVVVIWSIAL